MTAKRLSTLLRGLLQVCASLRDNTGPVEWITETRFTWECEGKTFEIKVTEKKNDH